MLCRRKAGGFTAKRWPHTLDFCQAGPNGAKVAPGGGGTAPAADSAPVFTETGGKHCKGDWRMSRYW